MLTATCEPTVANFQTAAQIETLPSDAEISRRVLAIRNGWTVSERINRRREAENRFMDLVAQLELAEAA